MPLIHYVLVKNMFMPLIHYLGLSADWENTIIARVGGDEEKMCKLITTLVPGFLLEPLQIPLKITDYAFGIILV